MASTSGYNFNGLGRIGNDVSEQSQRTAHNTRFANHMLADYFSTSMSDKHVKFATQQPIMQANGLAHGTGLNPNVVDINSLLTLDTQQQRHHEKLQLHQRAFASVPYMGRGSVNPDVETKLMQGDDIFEKRSEMPVTDSERSFNDVHFYPLDDEAKDKATNPKFRVQEAALSGWVRGGSSTREMNDDPRMN
jgi:hypothetical protein